MSGTWLLLLMSTIFLAGDMQVSCADEKYQNMLTVCYHAQKVNQEMHTAYDLEEQRALKCKVVKAERDCAQARLEASSDTYYEPNRQDVQKFEKEYWEIGCEALQDSSPSCYSFFTIVILLPLMAYVF